MVEDPVHHDAHAATVRGVQQLVQRGVAAQQGIDAEVVIGVVAVIARRGKHGIQVERVDAQLLQIVQAVHDAEQVATLVALLGRGRAPLLEADAGRVLKARAACEAVRKDLIEDSVFDPIGCFGCWLRCVYRHLGSILFVVVSCRRSAPAHICGRRANGLARRRLDILIAGGNRPAPHGASVFPAPPCGIDRQGRFRSRFGNESVV